MILTGEMGSTGRETCDSGTSLTTSFTRTELGSNTGIWGERRAIGVSLLKLNLIGGFRVASSGSGEGAGMRCCEEWLHPALERAQELGVVNTVMKFQVPH